MEERVSTAMKERVIQALQHDESVIFQNNFTGRLSLFNGNTQEFDYINDKCFYELLNDGIIKQEWCICQGDTRYILNK